LLIHCSYFTYGNKRLNTVFTDVCHSSSISWVTIVGFTSPSFCTYNIHFNIILYLHLRNPRKTALLPFSHQNIVYIFIFLHTYRMPCNSLLFTRNYDNNLRRCVKSHESPPNVISPTPCQLILLRTKYSLRHPVLE